MEVSLVAEILVMSKLIQPDYDGVYTSVAHNIRRVEPGKYGRIGVHRS